MPKVSKLRIWARDVGMSDRGVARLLDVSPWTVVSWRREPANWRERLIEGLEREAGQLRGRGAAEHDEDRSS
jgi:hypothetical protein